MTGRWHIPNPLLSRSLPRPRARRGANQGWSSLDISSQVARMPLRAPTPGTCFWPCPICFQRMFLHQPDDFPCAPTPSGLCCGKQSPSCRALPGLATASDPQSSSLHHHLPLELRSGSRGWTGVSRTCYCRAGEEAALCGVTAGWLRALTVAAPAAFS